MHESLIIVSYLVGIGGSLLFCWLYYRTAKRCYEEDDKARRKSILSSNAKPPSDGR